MEFIIVIAILFFGTIIASKMERIESEIHKLYELEAKRQEEA